MPHELVEEIDDRNEGGNRAKWIREAVKARIEAEDAGEWTEPELEPPTEAAEAD